MDKKDKKATNCYREKAKNLIALDETVVKTNKKAVYSAVDAERNEPILMRAYTTRNWMITRSFVREVLKYCKKKPKFDKAPWLIDALKNWVCSLNIKPLGERNKVESVFSLKLRIKIFFCSISCLNPARNWDLLCKLFKLYYNRLRWCLC